MPRKKSLTPKLYKRGAKGNWCFRRFVNGKDKEINTGTSVEAEAKKYLKQYITLEIEAENRNMRGELAVKTAQIIIQSVRGEGLERFTFEDGFRIYLDTTENFMSLCKRYRDIFTTTCKKFFSWCQARNLQYMDEVTDEVARNYARILTEDHISYKSFDDYIKILSKFFATVDAMKKLPNRNPFNKVNIRRKQKGVLTEASHRPLEPNMIHAVMQSAAIAGQDIFDLFTVALYTGMRLKDAALLEWKSVGNDFLCIAPYKTLRFGTIAKVPISGDLRGTLSRRLKERDFNQYVNPVMAMLYREDDGHKICKKSQKIFVQALGKENTIIPKGEHRKIDSSIYSFESFRTTFATLLGYNNTEYRTVMEMMGWNSWNMLKVYEKKYQFNSRSRDLEKIRSVEKLGILSSCIAGIVPVAPKLQPTKEALEKLLPTYSNVAIGRIYGISDVAIGNWLDKFGLVREKRIESPDLSEAEIQRIREELQAA